MVKLSVDLNEPKDSSKTDKAAQNGRTPKSLTLKIHHGGWFTPTPSRSYIGEQVSSVNVVDIDEFCLHDLKDMVVKLVYGVEDLMYCHFLITSLGLDYGLHSLNVDVDVLEMEKYLGMRTRDEITRNESTGNEITGKQMVVHVGNSSTVDDVLELGMLFETEEVGPVEVFKEMGLINNESEEESDHTRSYTWIVVLWSQDDDLDCHWIMTHLARASNLLVRKLWNEELRNIQLEPRKDTLILVKNDNERVRVRCEGTIPALVPYVAIDTNTDKNVFSQTKGGPAIRENINSGKQNILGKDKTMEGKGKKVNTPKKVDKNSCLGTHALLHTLKNATTGNSMKNAEQFEVGVSKMKAFRAKRIAYDIMTGSYREQYSLLREYAQELINQNPGTTVQIDVQQEPNPESITINFRRVQKGLIQAISSVFPSAEHRYCVKHIHENMMSQFEGGVYKEMLWNAAKATSEDSIRTMEQSPFFSRAKCDLLINNICEVLNRQLVDGRGQPIITCLEYIREYSMKRIVVVQNMIAKTVGPLTPSVTKMFDAIKKRLMSIMLNGMEVFLYQVKEPLQVRLETWAHVYSFKVNPCNGRDMWPVVESRTVIILPLYKPPIGGSPKEEERMSQMMRLQVKVFRQASFLGRASQSVVVNVAIQAAGATNVSGQAAGARKVSGQAAGAGKASSQPSAAQSTTKQGPRQDSVMSDSDESGVTYTEVSSPFEDLSDIGSPRADDHEYLELPGMPEDPYVEAALQAPPSPDYIVAEDQPGAEDASPTAQSPDYVPESDPEADPEEDDDEDPEEDPVDYPADGGDDGDDEEGSSEDDEDDDMDIEADDEEEEEEHLAPADSVVVALPATDQAPSAEETEPFETDESTATPPPHPAYRVTARISIPAPVPTPVWSDAEVARLFAISTSPSSPLSSWSSPLPQIPYPSLPLSPPSPVLSPAPPPSPIRSLGYRAAMIRMRTRCTIIRDSHTRPAAPSSGTPPLHLLSTDRREDRPEVTLPPRKRLGIALGPAYEVGESSSAAATRSARGLRADYDFVATMDREIRCDPEREVGYGITDLWDEIVETLQGAPVSTDTELGRHMTEFETRVRQDTDEIYTRLDDEQKARLSQEAWRRSMDASDLANGEVMSLRTTVLGQMSEIRELHTADRRRQTVTSEMLKAEHTRSAEMRELRTTDHTRQQQLIQTLTVMQSLQGQVTTLQGQVTTLQGHVTALQGQQGPAGGPAQPELPEEAGSSS
ncbi:hypothetical protein Tco_0321296 [Tanacetum coccineum]